MFIIALFGFGGTALSAPKVDRQIATPIRVGETSAITITGSGFDSSTRVAISPSVASADGHTVVGTSQLQCIATGLTSGIGNIIVKNGEGEVPAGQVICYRDEAELLSLFIQLLKQLRDSLQDGAQKRKLSKAIDEIEKAQSKFQHGDAAAAQQHLEKAAKFLHQAGLEEAVRGILLTLFFQLVDDKQKAKPIALPGVGWVEFHPTPRNGDKKDKGFIWGHFIKIRFWSLLKTLNPGACPNLFFVQLVKRTDYMQKPGEAEPKKQPTSHDWKVDLPRSPQHPAYQNQKSITHDAARIRGKKLTGGELNDSPGMVVQRFAPGTILRSGWEVKTFAVCLHPTRGAIVLAVVKWGQTVQITLGKDSKSTAVTTNKVTGPSALALNDKNIKPCLDLYKKVVKRDKFPEKFWDIKNK